MRDSKKTSTIVVGFKSKVKMERQSKLHISRITYRLYASKPFGKTIRTGECLTEPIATKEVHDQLNLLENKAKGCD